MSQVQSVFTAEGTLLALGNNQPFWLNDPEMAWLIQTGKVDLFAVPLQAGEPTGPRNHFLRAEAGQVLFGIPAGNSGAGLGFLAVGSNDARLYRLPLPRLQALARESDRAKELAQWIDGWVQELYRSLSEGLPPTQFEALRAGEDIALGEYASARPDDGLVWVRQTQGKSLLADKEDLVLTPEIAPLPVSASVWIYAQEQSSVLCLDTETMLRQNLAWSSLARFYEVVKNWAAAKVEQGVNEESARLEAKADSQRLAVEQAVSHLSGLLATGRAKRAVTEEAGDHLLSACLLIGQSLGITIKPHPAAKKGRPQKDPLGNIAKASRVRLRRVMLTGEWWKQDNGPILAFLQETNGPVALLPTSATSYDLSDPAAGLRQPVTPETAQSLNPLAYTFYRPFADRALKVWEVFKFGLHNTRSDILMVLFMGVIGGMLGMLTPIVTGLIFDSVIPSADGGQLKFLTLALLVGAFASVIFHVTRGIALLRVEAKSDASIQGAVWDRLLSLPLPFFRQYTSGDLAMRANGISAIREILSGAVLTSVLGGVFSVFNFGLLFFYSPKLALVATLLVVLNVAATTLVSFFSLRFQRPLYELQGKISGQVLQFITGISKLRVAGAEVHAYAVWAKGFSGQKCLDLKTGTLFIGLSVFNEIYPILTSICLFGAMAFWAEPGMTTGKFLAFSAAFMTFLYAMLDMSGALISILHTVPIYERAKPILVSLPEVSEAKSDPGELSGKIELSHVSFRYKQDGPLILRDVSFQINPGEFVAIVGPYGSGKSTLFRLLLGFENPESGTIYYDGLDLAGLDVQAVRRQFGVVLQNGKLMPGDIYQNVVGSSLLTLDDAWEAARKAGFDEEIKQMPMGMHTVLSEGAGTLSGGQRQRLMIARAIVAKPRILLFDEATSALDNRTQAIVSKSLEQLQATRIVIAHRLSTIINADRILVMQGGRLLQTGHYEQLMKQPGPFAELARRQLA